MLVSTLPPSMLSVVQLPPPVVLVNPPAPLKFTAPAPPRVAQVLSAKFTFSDPMFSVPALLKVPPLRFSVASVIGELV